MATSKSIDALLVRSGLCAAPGFLSCGSKIEKRRHCTVSKLWEANIPCVLSSGAGKEELLQTHEVFGDNVSECTHCCSPLCTSLTRSVFPQLWWLPTSRLPP